MTQYTYVEWQDIPASHVERPNLEDMQIWKGDKVTSSHTLMSMALHKSLRERGGLLPGQATTCRVFYTSEAILKESDKKVMLLTEYKVGPKE